ncbi:MAG: MBL fold metallo-hydrolase [Phenylobacterium sp.]
MRVTGVLVALYALLFAILGVALWTVPDQAAARLGVEVSGLLGLATVRADLGGLFVGLAGLGLAGLIRGSRLLVLAAAGVLAAIVAGRLIGWAATGALSPVPLAVELVAVAVLVLHARGLARPARPGRALLILAAASVALSACAGLMTLPGVEHAILAQGSRHAVGRDNSALLSGDALRVAICGSSAPLPSPGRAKACVAVMAGGKFYIVDAGPESVETLMQWGLPLGRIAGALITHFHSDHIGDLGELNLQTWAAGRPQPLPVYGGPGVEGLVAGFDQAYALDQVYRTAHHGPKLMNPVTWPLVARTVILPGPATPAKSRTALVLDDGAMRITAIEVDHGPIEPAYAYRFDYRGRSVVITGDTKAHAPLVAASRGADVLISEALNRPMIRTLETQARAAHKPGLQAIMHDIQDYHVSPVEAAGMGNGAGVKLLVFYHLLPAPDNWLARRMFARGVSQARRGDWDISSDGSLYTMPVGSKEVRIGHVQR